MIRQTEPKTRKPRSDKGHARNIKARGAIVFARVYSEVREELATLAASENCTISDYVNRALEQHLQSVKERNTTTI